MDNSSLTGIDFEGIAVSEGRLKTYLTVTKDYYNLAGATALFYQGDILGLLASGGDESIREFDPGEPSYMKYYTTASWLMDNNGPVSLFLGYKEVIISDINGAYLVDRSTPPAYAAVSYTLVDTEAEPVPEPLTAGAAALALAGLSWLKHKKKNGRLRCPGTSTIKQSAVTFEKILSWQNLPLEADKKPGLCQIATTKNA